MFCLPQMKHMRLLGCLFIYTHTSGWYSPNIPRNTPQISPSVT